MAFLNGILKYLNALTIELQGERKLICDIIQSVSTFCHKIILSEQDIEQTNSFIFRQFLN